MLSLESIPTPAVVSMIARLIKPLWLDQVSHVIRKRCVFFGIERLRVAGGTSANFRATGKPTRVAVQLLESLDHKSL
jgi:hypothetical protein